MIKFNGKVYGKLLDAFGKFIETLPPRGKRGSAVNLERVRLVATSKEINDLNDYIKECGLGR